MLAFVDVGDAKAAACGPVLTGARAAAQRTDKGKPRDDVGQGTTAKSESGKASKPEKKEQKKKFLGIFSPLSAMRPIAVGQRFHDIFSPCDVAHRNDITPVVLIHRSDEPDAHLVTNPLKHRHPGGTDA